jgi:hypothetical protein
VQVDEARGGDEAGAVDGARPAGDGEPADGDDPVAAQRQVALAAGPAGAVVEGGPPDDDVGPDGLRPLRGTTAKPKQALAA